MQTIHSIIPICQIALVNLPDRIDIEKDSVVSRFQNVITLE